MGVFVAFYHSMVGLNQQVCGTILDAEGIFH
jgi:hypothetical protein